MKIEKTAAKKKRKKNEGNSQLQKRDALKVNQVNNHAFKYHHKNQPLDQVIFIGIVKFVVFSLLKKKKRKKRLAHQQQIHTQ